MEPVFQIVYANKMAEESLKVYPDRVTIKKPVARAYRGVGDFVKLGFAVAGLMKMKHMEQCILLKDIERIEIKESTKSMPGIIQFYLKTGPKQSKATIANHIQHTDAFCFYINDAATVDSMVRYINAARVK